MKTLSRTLILAAIVSFTSATTAGEPRHHHAAHHAAHHQHHGHGGHAYKAHHYGNYGHSNYGHSNYGHGYYPYAYGYTASTYIEGRLRGVAAVLRADGQRNVLNAQAARLLEDAERMELENDIRRTETYFAKKQINREATTRDTLEQRIARRQRIANSSRPDRLGPTQYRSDLGLLNWPATLRGERFAELRSEIDKLVAVGPRAMDQGGSRIHQLAGQMRTAMKSVIHDVPPHNYMAARKFLESLQYEAQLGVRGTAVAAR